MNDIIDDDFMDVDVDAVAAAIAMSTGGQVLAPSTMNGHEASVAPPATSAATSPSRMSTGASPGKTAAAAAATRRRSRASTAETGVYAQFMDRLLDRLSGKRARKSDGKSATNDASTATSEAKMTTISADIVRVLEHAERRGKRKLARAITGRLSTGVRSPVGATSSTSSHLRRVLGEAVAMSSMAATCKSDVASSTTKPVPSLDPRFTAGHALSSRHAVSSLKPTFTLQLYAHHFKLANYDGAFSYDGPMRVFVDAVDEQVLVPDLGDLLEEAQCPFYDGCALVEVQDYRAASNTANASASALTARQDGPTMTMPTALSVPAKHSTRRVLLRPSAVTFMADVQAFHVGNGGPLNDEQMLELEGRLLLHTEPDVCLDPRPAVARLANIVEYNKRKFHAVVKWRRRAAAVADLEIDASSASAGGSVGSVKMDAAAEQERLMTMIAGATRAQQEAHGSFKLISFVDDWRRTQNEAERTPLDSLDKSNRNRAALSSSTHDTAHQLVRSVKFSRQSVTKPGTTLYTSLNIYADAIGGHEAILRWGDQPDTAIHGQTLRFPLGNATDAEKYVQNLQNLYCGAEQHTLIHDVRSGDASATKKRPTGTDAAFSTTSSSLEGTVLSSVPASASGVRSGAVSPALTALSATNLLSTGAPSIPTTTTAELAALAATSVSDNPLSLDAPSAIAAPGLAGQTLRNNQLNMLLLQQQMQQRQRNQQALLQQQQKLVQKQQVGAQLSRVDLATFAAAQQQMAGVGGALPASSISNVLGSSATSPNSTNLNNVGAGQQTSTFSSSQATNPQNVQFIHKLLRLPFSQVPELHRTLYLQLRQRLQSRGAPNATGNMAQMTQAQLQNINLATLLGTNSPGQAAGSQPAQTAPIQMQRQQLLAQAQAVRQQQLQQQAFIAAQGATGQLGNQTTSAGTQQFTAAQLNAIQQQLVQQQLMASNSNVNAAGLSNIMNMGAVRSSQPGQGGAAGSLADQQQPAVTTLLLQQQQQAAAAAKQQLQRDTKSPSPARRPK